MNDTISRQSAIDALYEMLHDCFWADDEELDAVITTLNDLPSAEPEIVRCKDCKYWEQNAQHGYDEDNEEYHNYCARLVPDDDYYAYTREANEFCSRGERKRRGE